jgi:hypothetical protein
MYSVQRTTYCVGVLHQDGFLLRERVIAVYARRGAQNAESLLNIPTTYNKHYEKQKLTCFSVFDTYH